MIIKEKLWLLCLCYLPLCSIGQSTFSKLYLEGAESKPTGVEILNDSLLIVVGDDLTDGCAEPFLTAYTLNGELRWTYVKRELKTPIRAISTFGGKLYVVGSSLEIGDTPLPINRQFELAIFSAAGELRSISLGPIFDTDLVPRNVVKDMAISSEGKIAVVSNNALAFADTAGVFEERLIENVSSTLSHVEFLSGEKLVVTDSLSASILTLEGEIQNQLTFADSVVGLVAVDENIFLCTATKLYQLNNDLSAIDSLELANFFQEVYQLSTDGSELHVQGKSGNTVGVLRVQNDLSQPNLQEGILPTRSILTPFQEGWVGSSTTLGFTAEIPENTLSFWVPFADSLQANPLIDIAITDFQVDSIYAEFILVDTEPFFNAIKYTYTIKVKNEGVEPISFFATHISDEFVVSCTKYSIYTKEEATMEAGEETEITRTATAPFFLSLGDDIYTECITVLAPNGLLETNLSQNELCVSLDVSQLDTVIVSVGIEDELGNDLSIYPNPVEEELQIAYSGIYSPNMKVSLFSLQGKLLVEESFRESNMGIPMDQYPAGIYLLHIQKGSRGIWRKVVKE